MAERERLPITAIILTLDEERNIQRCLECLERVDDVAVVDSLSTDETIAAARDRSRHALSLPDPGDQLS